MKRSVSTVTLFVLAALAMVGCRQQVAIEQAREKSLEQLLGDAEQLADIHPLNFGVLSLDESGSTLQFRRPRYDAKQELVEETLERFRTEQRVVERTDDSGKVIEETVSVRVPYHETQQREVIRYAICGEQLLTCPLAGTQVRDARGNQLGGDQLQKILAANVPAVLLPPGRVDPFYARFLQDETLLVSGSAWEEPSSVISTQSHFEE